MEPIWTEERLSLARQAAERWRGTPWVDHACIPGAGVDCVNFVAAICRECGVLPADYEPPEYDSSVGLYKQSTLMEETILAMDCVQVERTDPAVAVPGDIVVFRDGENSAHVGILLCHEEVWHSLVRRGVVATPWSLWKARASVCMRVVSLTPR